jgi:hypothetical protein
MPFAQKLCLYGHGVFTSRTCVNLKHYFTSKSFAAVCEASKNAYPKNEIPNKKTIHQMLKQFRDAGSICL